MASAARGGPLWRFVPIPTSRGKGQEAGGEDRRVGASRAVGHAPFCAPPRALIVSRAHVGPCKVEWSAGGLSREHVCFSFCSPGEQLNKLSRFSSENRVPTKPRHTCLTNGAVKVHKSRRRTPARAALRLRCSARPASLTLGEAAARRRRASS